MAVLVGKRSYFRSLPKAWLAVAIYSAACGSTDAAPSLQLDAYGLGDSAADGQQADAAEASDVTAVAGDSDTADATAAYALTGTWSAPASLKYGATTQYTWTFSGANEVSYQTVITSPASDPYQASCIQTGITTGTYAVNGNQLSLSYAQSTLWTQSCQDPLRNHAKKTGPSKLHIDTTLTFAGPDAFVVGGVFDKTDGAAGSLVGSWKATDFDTDSAMTVEYTFKVAEWLGSVVVHYTTDSAYMPGCTNSWLTGPGSYKVTDLPGGLSLVELTSTKRMFEVQGCELPSKPTKTVEDDVMIEPLGYLSLGAKQAILGYPYQRVVVP